jgi:hypothetical protein
MKKYVLLLTLLSLPAAADWFNPDAVIIQNYADESISCKFVDNVDVHDNKLFIKIRCRMARQLSGDCTASRQCDKIIITDELAFEK